MPLLALTHRELRVVQYIMGWGVSIPAMLTEKAAFTPDDAIFLKVEMSRINDKCSQLTGVDWGMLSWALVLEAIDAPLSERPSTPYMDRLIDPEGGDPECSDTS